MTRPYLNMDLLCPGAFSRPEPLPLSPKSMTRPYLNMDFLCPGAFSRPDPLPISPKNATCLYLNLGGLLGGQLVPGTAPVLGGSLLLRNG